MIREIRTFMIGLGIVVGYSVVPLVVMGATGAEATIGNFLLLYVATLVFLLSIGFTVAGIFLLGKTIEKEVL